MLAGMDVLSSILLALLAVATAAVILELLKPSEEAVPAGLKPISSMPGPRGLPIIGNL